MVNVFSPEAYKRTNAKDYVVRVCKPPTGTCVVNKELYPDMIGALNGREFLTAQEYLKLSATHPGVAQALVTRGCVCSDNHVVVQDVVGMLSVVDMNTVVTNYVTMDNMKLSMEYLADKMYYYTKGLSTGGYRLTKTKLKTAADQGLFDRSTWYQFGYFPWFKIKYKASDDFAMFAAYIPLGETPVVLGGKQANLRGFCDMHGKGDFVICYADIQGLPNFSTMQLILGLRFGLMYNTRNFKGCTDQNFRLGAPFQLY